MLAHVVSAALQGVDSYLVRVEVTLAPGLPTFAVVGLPQGAVREGRERVSAALRHAGFPLPVRRITVNLAPADVRKEGSALDLPLAVGLLAAEGHVPHEALEGTAFLGELGLDGTLRPGRGALPVALRCVREGVPTLILPSANAREASVVEGLQVVGAPGLKAVADHLRGTDPLPATVEDPAALLDVEGSCGLDLRDVVGQDAAKRALEVAAAGGHNVLLLGPPGSGKTMLARRLPGILPPLTVSEALDVTGVHSVAGLLSPGQALVVRRPFRAPHHTVSDAGLVGGGSSVRPGEVSIAHQGVLFLDELAEFRRHVLEVLRQPMEDGHVNLSRARVAARFPARFLLVAAMNPCPCGYSGDGSDRCLCDPARIARYLGRVSGPLLDRIDIHMPVAAVPFEALSGRPRGDPSARIRRRVVRAREIQRARFRRHPGVSSNADMGLRELRRYCHTSPEVGRLLRDAVDRLALSARAYHRILKLARTVADLEGADTIRLGHAAEAIQYRSLDRTKD